jgi:hypothetical protein
VTALGPGYDHHAVPNRQPLVVDREGGAFYARMWEQFLAYNLPRRAKLVLVETWNELHEGTDVCETKEYGRRFIDLTAKYAQQFREGVVLPKRGPFAAAAHVEWDADRDEKLGVTLRNSGDGLMEPAELADRKCWRTRQSENGGKYVYLDLDDSFLFDEENAGLAVELEYLDRGFASFALEYDSVDPLASVREGAFKSLGLSVGCGGTGKWMRFAFVLAGGRFANRCNGGDFRFAVSGGELAISRVAAARQK